MLFNWETKTHGRCLVSSLASADYVSVIIAWDVKTDGCAVEYRITNNNCDDEPYRVDRATRLAMAHFEVSAVDQTGLINLAIDSSSTSFAGRLPGPLH